MSKSKFPFTAEELLKAGYARTSNKYRMASRIDRPDWREHMACRMHPFHPETAKRLAERMGRAHADLYRRVYGEDTLEGIPASIFKKLPNSGDLNAPSEHLPK